jgi:hypothetical protein
MSKNTKRERFEKVAARRTQKILDYLESLSKCSNRNNYEYSEEDVRKMIKAIKEKLAQTEATFEGELSKSKKNQFKF